MKRSSSAPCLADDGNTGSKKVKEDSDEPTGREYLQLALARVLELQRQVKDDTYTTDNTSDLGESDSEEDVMKEVLIKVFKDLPGSSSAVTTIINRATLSQPPQVRAIRDKRVQLAGYDTCRKVALEFMNTVVKNTPITDSDYERFEMGIFSKIEPKIADHKTGLTGKRDEQSKGENSKNISTVQNELQNYTSSSQILPRGEIFQFAKLENGYYNKQSGNNSNHLQRCELTNLLSAVENVNNLNRDIDKSSQTGVNRMNYFEIDRNPIPSSVNIAKVERETTISRDYEIRVRMLKGLDLHLATKQRDFTARLMRQ